MCIHTFARVDGIVSIIRLSFRLANLKRDATSANWAWMKEMRNERVFLLLANNMAAVIQNTRMLRGFRKVETISEMVPTTNIVGISKYIPKCTGRII
jgi:hypothetical protein